MIDIANDRYITCNICKHIPDATHVNFMEVPEHVPEIYKPLDGWDGQNLGNGYSKFTVTCPDCQTKYLVEIDVEALVWDFDVTRLVGKTANYQGYYMPNVSEST